MMDCTFKTKRGNFNYRVGVIITNGRKILMARNPNEERAFTILSAEGCASVKA